MIIHGFTSERACYAMDMIQARGGHALTVTLAVMGGAQQNQPVVQEKKEYQAWLARRLGAAQGFSSRRWWKL